MIKEIFMDIQLSLWLTLWAYRGYLEAVSSRALGEHMNLPALAHLEARSQDKSASIDLVSKPSQM